ncbi:MAG: OmpA family protein [Aureispira sp.]|nr:OmpA family protein [Aureispira sp.]
MNLTLHSRVWLAFSCLYLSLISYSQQQNYTIHFDVNQHYLNEQSKTLLEQEFQVLKYHPSAYSVQVIGHTDNVGSLAFNKKLSLQRCESAKQYLIDQGFDSSEVKIRAEAYKKPIAANQTDNGRAQNRRVELILTPQKIEVPNQSWSFDAEAGGTFLYDRSMTRIHIPKGALLYPDGSPVKGEIDLEYKEYRDVADFVFSGIPMTYQGMPFNSAGMFEIRAFQEGKELSIDQKKGISIDFVLTDTLPQLSFYEYNENNKKWRAVEALDRKSQQNDLRGKLQINNPPVRANEGGCAVGRRQPVAMNQPIIDVVDELDKACPADIILHNYFPKADTLEIFQKALELGIHLTSLEKLNIPRYQRNYYLNFNERWKNKEYAGTKFVGENHRLVSGNKAYYNIKISKDKKLSKGRLSINIEDLSGENPELAVLAEHKWYMMHRTRRKQKYLPAALSRNWSDVELKANGTRLSLKLKGYGYHQNLNIYPILKRKQLKNQRSIIQKIAQNTKKQRLEQATKFNKIVADSQQLYFQYLAIDQLLKTEDDRCKTFNEWRTHIKENKDSMNLRYQHYLANNSISLIDSLIENVEFKYINANRLEANMDPINANWQQGGQFAPVPIPYNPNLSNETEAQRAQRVAKEKVRLRNLATSVVSWQGRQNLDAGHTFPPLVQKLFLDGFGVFNNDQIQILGNTQRVLASYEDQEGNPIEGKVLSMIDYTINGAMSFPPKSIAFNPKAKNAFLLFATNGKKYILKADDLKKQLKPDMTSCTFVMEDVSSSIKTPNDLKKELGLNL